VSLADNQDPTSDPDPPWVSWDHRDSAPWPLPDDSTVDLNSIEGPAWLDDARGVPRVDHVSSPGSSR